MMHKLSTTPMGGKKIQFLLLATLFSVATVHAQKIRIITTTTDKPWVEQKYNAKAMQPVAASQTVTVYADSLMQKVEGIGGTFNELGWDALQALPADKQAEVMKSLFGPTGVNFSMARTPVGASDYALSYYSYCDVKEDFSMRDFSIARDRFILIPFIKAGLKLRPDLKIWASPWTPPAWMKINEHYTQQGGDIGGRKGGNEMEPRKNIMGNVTGFNMQVGYLKAYALYFSKYIKAYQAEGVNIWALMPQNEIAWSPNWPCCTWRPEDFALFIGKYLGPQFKADSINTEVWLGTVNFPDPDYVRAFLKNKDAASVIKGVGFQWTGEKSLPFIQKEFPKYKYMQTENMCGEHENDWTSLEKSWKSILHYFKNGASSYMYWNMILDETGKSSWGWPQNSMVIIDKTTKQVRYTPEYYLMKHISHFVQPGSVLIKTSLPANAIAFRTADNKTTLVIYNPESAEKTVAIQLNGAEHKIKLAPVSLSTVVL